MESPADLVLVRPPTTMSYHTLGPDIGLGFLSTACKRAGLSVKILDLQLKSFPKKRDYIDYLLRKIGEHKASHVGIKLFTVDMEFATEASQHIKATYPDVKVIGGGPHPSGMGKDVLNQLPHFEYAFRGEAEIGLPKLLNDLLHGEGDSPLKDIPGLIYRKPTGDIEANPRGFVKDLDSLGMPDYEEMPPYRYPLNYTGDVFIPIMTTRGCPFQCRYCAGNLITGRKLRHRSPAAVVEEVKQLRQRYGIDSFSILDDNFIFDNEYAKSFLRVLIESRLGIPWSMSGGIRLDKLDAELVQMMEESGCKLVYVSLESGSQKTLNLMDRACNLGTIIEKVHLVKRWSKMSVTAFFIIGYPGETAEDVEKTIQLARELPVSKASFFFFVPFPGTPVWGDLAREGLLQTGDGNWSKYSLHKHAISLKEIPAWKLELLKWKGYLMFYGRPSIIKAILKDIHNPYQFYRFLQRSFQVLFNR